MLCLLLREFNAKTAEYKDVPLRVLIKVRVQALLQPVVAVWDIVQQQQQIGSYSQAV
jgi:hypothetical protein